MFAFNKLRDPDHFSHYPETNGVSVTLFYRYSDNGSLKLFRLTECEDCKSRFHRQFFTGNNNFSFSTLSVKHLASRKLLFIGNFGISQYLGRQKLAPLDFKSKQRAYQIRLASRYTNFSQGNVDIRF